MVRAYVTKQIGAGKTRADAIRSTAHNYISIALGGRFREYDHPARLYSFIICDAPNANHIAMQADPDIYVFSQLVDNLVDFKEGIDVQVSTLGPVIQTAV